MLKIFLSFFLIGNIFFLTPTISYAGIGGAIVKGVAKSFPKIIKALIKGFFLKGIKTGSKFIIKSTKSKILKKIKTKEEKNYTINEINNFIIDYPEFTLQAQDLINQINKIKIKEIKNETKN